MGVRLAKIDDPIDAFAVHGAAGAWGTIACALFDMGAGVDQYNGWSGFMCVMSDGKCRTGAAGDGIVANILEVVTIALWVAACSAVIFTPLRLAGFLRASDQVQEEGYDATKHSPSKAYAGEVADGHGGEVVSC